MKVEKQEEYEAQSAVENSIHDPLHSTKENIYQLLEKKLLFWNFMGKLLRKYDLLPPLNEQYFC